MAKPWPTKRLDEIAKIVGGSTPSRDHPEYWGGDIPWVTPTDLPMPGEGIGMLSKSAQRISRAGLDSCAANLLPPGTVLLSTRATIGKLGIASTTLATNQGFCNLIPSDCVDSRFLAYTLWHQTPQIERLAGSTTFREVNRSALRRLSIAIPPLPEQRRIVAILDEAERLRTLRRQAGGRTADLIPAFFHDMFTRRAAHWSSDTVAGLAEDRPGAIRTGPFGSELRHGEFVESGVPVLGIENVTTNRFCWTRARCVPPERFQAFERFRVFPGDVMVTIMGTVGRVCVAPPELPLCMSTKHLCVITPDRSRAISDYLWAALLFDPSVRRQV